MLKARTTDGKIIFGLTKINIDKLKEGKPIKIDMAEMHGEGFIYIVYGETASDIAKELGLPLVN